MKQLYSLRRKQRVLLCSLGLITVSPSIHAQLFQDATNSTAVVVRDPARQASTDIDAVIYNPAGTALLDQGWHFSLNGNASYRALDYEVYQDGALQGTNHSKIYNVMPSLQLAYKKDKLTLSASFAQEGGYGNWKDRDKDFSIASVLVENELLKDASLQEAQSLYKLDMILMEAMGVMPTTGTFLPKAEDNMTYKLRTGQQTLRNYTLRLGGAYQVNSHLSAYLGLKANFVRQVNETNIRLLMERPSTGEHWEWRDYFTAAAATFREEAKIPNEHSEFYSNLAQTYSNLAEIGEFSVALKEESRQHSLGIAPILGLDYQISNFNFGATYEFQTHAYSNNGETINLPAILSLGANWRFIPQLKLALGYTHHFKTKDMLGYGKKEHESIYRLSASLEYNPLDKLAVSAGITYSHVGDLYNLAVGNMGMPSRPDISYALGLGYNVTKCLQLNLGYGLSTRHCILNSNLLVDDDMTTTTSVHDDTHHLKHNMAIGLNVHF